MEPMNLTLPPKAHIWVVSFISLCTFESLSLSLHFAVGYCSLTSGTIPQLPLSLVSVGPDYKVCMNLCNNTGLLNQ